MQFLFSSNYVLKTNNKNGRWPDPLGADTIKNIPALTSILMLQTFLGLVNYYQSIPNMHKLRAQLNDLLKKS